MELAPLVAADHLNVVMLTKSLTTGMMKELNKIMKKETIAVLTTFALTA